MPVNPPSPQARAQLVKQDIILFNHDTVKGIDCDWDWGETRDVDFTSSGETGKWQDTAHQIALAAIRLEIKGMDKLEIRLAGPLAIILQKPHEKKYRNTLSGLYDRINFGLRITFPCALDAFEKPYDRYPHAHRFFALLLAIADMDWARAYDLSRPPFNNLQHEQTELWRDMRKMFWDAVNGKPRWRKDWRNERTISWKQN